MEKYVLSTLEILNSHFQYFQTNNIGMISVPRSDHQ